MIKTITPNDVLRYVYNETNEVENRHIEKAILVEEELSDLFTELTESKSLMDKVEQTPSNGVVNSIMQYAIQQNLQKA